MSLALRFLGVAGRDATHQRWQTPTRSIAQDRGDNAGKKRSTCGPCSDTMRISEAYCSSCVVVRNSALKKSASVEDRDVSFGRSFTQLGCNGAGLALDWALVARPLCELVPVVLCPRSHSPFSKQALEPCVLFMSESSLDSGIRSSRETSSQLPLAVACLRCRACHS